MIAGMRPRLQDGTFYFCTTDDAAVAEQAMPMALATFREDEGISLILPEAAAQRLGLPAEQPMRQITLGVYSALDGVGLTAAVATALAETGIACNMVAAFHHDHAFVPADRADEALACLTALSDATW